MGGSPHPIPFTPTAEQGTTERSGVDGLAWLSGCTVYLGKAGDAKASEGELRLSVVKIDSYGERSLVFATVWCSHISRLCAAVHPTSVCL